MTAFSLLFSIIALGISIATIIENNAISRRLDELEELH